MKREELVRLKRMLNKELERRTKSNLLLQEELVKKYLELNGINAERLQTDDIWPILKEILTGFEITETNGILVCIGAFITDCKITYEDTDYFQRQVPFNYEMPEYMIFKDIETLTNYRGYCDKNIEYLYIQRSSYYQDLSFYEYFQRIHSNGKLVSELLQNNIILNPYNGNEIHNNFGEVRKDFFETAIVKGQPAAKKLILSKYPIMK